MLVRGVEYKRCALLLYSLQIACANPKGFAAEQPNPELAEGEKAGGEKAKTSDEPSMAELVLGFLAKPEGDPGAEPRIRSREDYYAAVERRRQRDTASLPETSAG